MNLDQKRIFIWQGHHSQDAYALFRLCWQQNYLLICAPPSLQDFSFIRGLPPGEIEFCGQWTVPVPKIAATSEHTTFKDQPVLGVFTTGTTKGKPKLVLYSRENILTSQAAILEFFSLERIRGVFCYPQPYHVFGLLLGYALCHHRNIPLYFGDGPYSQHHHLRRLSLLDDRILTLGTPTHFRDLADFIQKNRYTIKPTYSCIIGGAKVTIDDWKLARNRLKIRRPSIGYGCTEASPGISHLAPGMKPQYDGEIGFPLSHLKVDVGRNGIVCQGPSVAMATVENGFLAFPKSIAIKDLVRTLPDGRMVFQGRTDFVLNRGGEKFALEKMESILRDKLQLETICVAVPDQRLGEELGILIAGQPTLVLPRQKIVHTLNDAFGRNFQKAHMAVIERLPVNHNSKLDRRLAGKILKDR